MMSPAERVQIGYRFHLFWRLLLLLAVVLAPLTSGQSSVAPVQTAEVQNSAPTTTTTTTASDTHSERSHQGGSDQSPPRDKSVVTTSGAASAGGGAAAVGDGEDTTLPGNVGDAVIRLVKAPDLGGGGEPKTNSRDETIIDGHTRLSQRQQQQGAVEVDVQAEIEVEDANAERNEQLMAIDRAMAAAAAALSAAAESSGSTSSAAAAASQALQLWRQAAELGSVDAAYNVAWHQLLGRLGVPVAVTEARQQLQQLAAEHGHADAQMAVGFLYATGLWANGSAADQRRALLYYTFAALGGSTPARMALGYRHLAGVHTPASCETALLYYQMASAHVIEQSTRHDGDSTSSSSAETPPPSAAAAASEVFNAGEDGGGVGGYGGGVRSLRVSRVRLYDEMEGGGSGGGSRGWTVSLNEDQIQYYQFLADKGDEQAQLALGQLLYQGGRGVRRDVHAALHYIRSAATAGSADAQAFLGKMYMEGSAAVTADAEQAMHHYRLASEKGSVAGHYGVGVLLARAGDHRQAIVHLERAAELGWPEAMVQLGTMYQRGDGVQPDFHKAFKYFFNAAQYGNLLAIYSIAQMYAKGSGAGRSCQIAVDLYKSVAERGSWAELFMEAHDDWLRAGGGATSGAATTATLKYLFLAELGYETAQSNAAYLLELAAAASSSSSSSSPSVLHADLLPGHQLYERALALWSRAAAQGYDVARVKVGDYHYYGHGTPVDLETAVDHYRIASDQLHSARAMFNLGYMHEHGLGLPADLHLAKRLYDQAAETSADAVVPVALVSIKLAGKFLLLRVSKLDWSNITPIVKLQQWSKSGLTLLEYFLFTYVDIGNNWDLYLMSLLTVFLLTSLLLRRMR